MPFETLEAKIKLVPPQYFQELADFADFLAYKAKRIEFESDERILEVGDEIISENLEAFKALAK